MKTKDTEIAKNDQLKYNPNVTEHDKDMLKQSNIHGDGGDDQQLKERERPVVFAGSDLDVPGRKQAKEGNGPRGLNDEENKVHSQGSAHNEDLEQDELP
ncbi:MAG: hypothetical protein R3359_03700 [Marinirhabdus sp.]|nr:hypothetical protein [Marinirhabdus sp.]